ncbi:MAG: flagellar hook-length control protein FliK [Gallionella sp.]|nr:flagellar hook-length control protein FliK [Gallionella sp.]
MTNLPISSNKPQPSGNTANASQANIATDTLTTDARPAEPFAILLARQIGEADLSALTAAQTGSAIAIDGSLDPALKNAQDQAAAVANTPSDPANTLAAILMQLPAPEDRMQKIDGKQATQSFVLGSSQEARYRKAIASSEDSQIIQLPSINHLPSEAINYAELPSDLTQPAQNTAQAIALQTMPATIPGMLANNTPVGTPPTITTPLGNNGWADEFSQKISWISTQQNQVAELRLNPPNLGPLDVVLKISDNQATALFTSPHAAVREAVENALPKLREILADNGIMLGNTTVSDQSPRDRSSDVFMNQGSGTAAQHEVSGTMPELAGLLPAAAPVRRHNGMVDTFA